ncbi:restriction endonuclease subunit S [Accumulibacter sp.]|uniref:restriction endonuclease subunit S n=1 Tax=Accumulibacter sp. TaxID=2053492 RepID=UPI00263241DA|nr:restriction endonuclease subunit S [Accumulibacter sp.]
MSDRVMPRDWRIWRFDEMATNVNVRIDNPSESGMERYVGLEHLDPDSLRIRRWGRPSDVEAGKLCFKTGDIIFAKRRAYQRKLGVAEFDGICSAHAMVLHAKPEVVLPDFLPFFMQSDAFMNRAIEISVGSLSPTINWKALAEQEFALPSTDEQKTLAEIFQAADEVTTALHESASALKTLMQATVDDFFGRGLSDGPHLLSADTNASPGWSCLSGSDLLVEAYILALKDGNHGSQYPRSNELGDSGFPYVAASDIGEDGELDLLKVRRLGVARAKALRIPPALPGDVILTHNATVGRVAILPPCDTPIVASTSTTYYRVNPEKLTNVVLASLMRSSLFKAQLASYMRQSTRNQVPITTQRRMHFLIPPFAEQLRFQELISSLQTQRNSLQDRLRTARSLVLQLSRGVFV